METEIEIDNFQEYLEQQNLSQNTIYQYVKYLKHYVNEYGMPNGQQYEVSKNIENLKLKKQKIKAEQASTKSQTLKAVIAYRKYKKLPNETIVELYNDVNKEARLRAEEQKAELNEKLMSFKEYNNKVNELYDEDDIEKIRAYLINKLLSISNCRNLDLVSNLITTKTEYKKMKDNENYLYLHKNDLYFIRNNYKTADKYGKKEMLINEPKHKLKLKKAFKLLHKKDNQLIPKDELNNLSRYILKKTFNLGETKIMKIMLKEKNTLGEAEKIGQNRGTSLSTLQQNYNIKE